MCIGEATYSFRCRDEAQESDAGCTGALERGDGCRGTSASREHRIEEEEVSLPSVSRHLEVVVHRLEGVVIPIEADMPDTGRWHEARDAFHHAKASAQDGHERQLLATDAHSRGALERGVHERRFQRKLAGRLIRDDRGDRVDELLEVT